ncbi:MAG: enterochelin esterase [Marinomonas sp.]
MTKYLDLTVLLDCFGQLHHQIGSFEWWESIGSCDMPLIKTQDNGESLVVFVWQDPQGNEKTSSTASVVLAVNSLTDHHSWEPECLNRVVGTDVWFGQLTVNSKWRGSYSFIPLPANQLPEFVKKQGDGTREAQRAWWLEVVANQIPDVLNKSPILTSGWGESSALHLPHAPEEEGWKEWDQGALPLLSVDQIQSIHWHSFILNNQRDCQLFSTAKGDASLVILLDGQKWGANSGTLSVLQYLTAMNKIAPAHYLLVPCIDGQTRWKELSCHRPFWQALIDELLPKIKIELAKSNHTVSDFVVTGQSLGGLSSLYAGLHFPEYFSKVISLSGSFWWPEVDRMQSPKSTELSQVTLVPNSLAEQIQNNLVDVQHLHAFLTVGSGEKDMCLYNDMTYQAIKEKGGNVYYETVFGGHDWLSWRSSLTNGLMHLLPAQHQI